MNLTTDFWIKTAFRFVEVTILPVFGMLVAVYYEVIPSKTVAVSIAASYAVLAATYVLFDQYRRFRQIELEQKAEDAEHRAKVLEDQSRLLSLAREGELLSSATLKVTELMYKINAEYSKLTDAPVNWDTRWVYNRKWEILKNICEVLKQDRKQFQGPSDYFKATLFRVVTKDHLKLECSHYPPGSSPTTSEIIRRPNQTATAFHCFDRQTMLVIPNVPQEAASGDHALWVELYTGQSKNYGSMVCAPITIGEKATDSFEVISILTIDTNRVDYFSDQPNDKNFLANLLAPFRQQLSFLCLTEHEGSKELTAGETTP